MFVERHSSVDYQEANRDTCRYCHRTPARWQQDGAEKVCAYCGTRVYTPPMPRPLTIRVTRAKSAHR